MTPFSLQYGILSMVTLLLTATLLSPLSLFGSEADAPDESERLTGLESYLERALIANPRLKAFEQRYEAAKHRIPLAATLPDPVLQITHFIESVQTRTGPQENAMVLSQRFPWFGKLKHQLQAATAEAEASWYAYQEQQLKLLRDVSFSFFEYAYTQEAIRLTRENYDLLTKLEPIVEAKVSSGGDVNALLRLKVEMGKTEDRLQSLLQMRQVQSSALSEILAIQQQGVLPWPEWEAPAPAIIPDTDLLVKALEIQNPELQMLQRKTKSAEIRQEIARLTSFPDLAFGINYIQIGNPVSNAAIPNASADPWGISISASLPIWLGKNKSTRQEALAMRNAADNEFNNRKNELTAEIQQRLAKLSDANRRLHLYGEELLDLAQQAVENSRSSYENGRAGILELIDSERSLLDLQLLFWRAAADAWQHRIVIQTLANQPTLETIQVTQEHE